MLRRAKTKDSNEVIVNDHLVAAWLSTGYKHPSCHP